MELYDHPCEMSQQGKALSPTVLLAVCLRRGLEIPFNLDPQWTVQRLSEDPASLCFSRKWKFRKTPG